MNTGPSPASRKAAPWRLGILMIVVVLNFLLNRLTKGEFSI